MEEGPKSFKLFSSLVAQKVEKEKEEKVESSELTFFYGGKVYSFHNISPLQVGAILSAADQQLKEASPPPLPSVVDLVHHQKEEKKPNYPIGAVVQQQQHLPLVNKASLARFLANRKRKQRLKILDNMKVEPTASSSFDDGPTSKKPRHTTTPVLQLFPL